MSAHPTIVVVPGAWQKPEAWAGFLKSLEGAGYDHILVTLPTVGGDELPLKGLEDDVAAVRAVLAKLAGEKQKALLLCHSAGGLVASNAVEGGYNDSNSVVTGIIYLTAFMIPKGKALLDMLGGQPAPWMELREDRVQAIPELLPQVAFNDLDGPAQARCCSEMTHTSVRLFTTPSAYEPWNQGFKCAFVFCSEDNAIPISIQRQMAAQLGSDETLTAELKSGHCPFISVPAQLLDAVKTLERRLL